MCLILFAWKMHRRCPLILIANRDELYDRPTAPLGFWDDAPGLLAGRDLHGGGTWLGITRSGRLAALTNYRDPASTRSDAPSRGRLVSDFLRGRSRPESYLRRVRTKADRYNGFNLLAGSLCELFCYSNRGGLLAVPPGIHGLSNHLLDTPWPKVRGGKDALARLLKDSRNPSLEGLFALLSDRTRPPDDHLPATGVGLEWERVLSPRFIRSPHYGTRSSTVLIIDGRGQATLVERAYNGSEEPWMTSRFDFHIAQAQKR